MLEHFKELLLLAGELLPAWLLIKVATRKGTPEEQSKRLLLIVVLMLCMGFVLYMYAWIRIG